MNLDSIYSELTLKTNAKLALLVMDGLGDVATREQGYVTPLEAARTPNMDALSKDSAHGRLIRYRTHQEGVPFFVRGSR